MKDGRRHTKRVDKLSGWVGFPLSREERMRKFHSCARRVLDTGTADRVVEMVEKLDQLRDVHELMSLVSGTR
jgi:hypothetical protein